MAEAGFGLNAFTLTEADKEEDKIGVEAVAAPSEDVGAAVGASFSASAIYGGLSLVFEKEITEEDQYVKTKTMKGERGKRNPNIKGQNNSIYSQSLCPCRFLLPPL